VHELAGDPAEDDLVGGAPCVGLAVGLAVGPAVGLGREHGEHRPQPFATGHDEVARDLGELFVGRLHRRAQGRFDASEVGLHPR
jgi:hypothetical protein